jgi:hypothetical protein
MPLPRLIFFPFSAKKLGENDLYLHMEKFLNRKTYVIYYCEVNILYDTISAKESTHDRVVASRVYETGLPEYIGRDLAPMTAYEIISIFIGILTYITFLKELLKSQYPKINIEKTT